MFNMKVEVAQSKTIKLHHTSLSQSAMMSCIPQGNGGDKFYDSPNVCQWQQFINK